MSYLALPQSFYLQETTLVARALIGKTLSLPDHAPYTIVETEAYLGLTDPACHSYHGRRTERVRSMYLEGGHSYVYLVYGMHHCLNVVTGDKTTPEAVLIRAIQPKGAKPPSKKSELKTNGPGKLCRELGINRSHDALKLWKSSSPIWIEDGEMIPAEAISAAHRIGIDGYGDECAAWPLRFYIRNNPWVSRL